MNKVRRGSAEDGQTLIEMAFVLPVFMLLLCGIASFSIILFGWCNLTFASRAAARYASLHSNTSLVPATQASVIAVVTPFLFAVTANSASTVVNYAPANTIGATVTVMVTAQYAVTMPFTTFTAFTLNSKAQRTITR